MSRELFEDGASAGSSVRSMRAAMLTGPRRIEISDVPIPEPGEGQVRVRIEGCGVCASNVTPWEGPEWMTFPTSPGGLGHEAWGVIDALGPGVTSHAVGDRVATLFENGYAQFDVGPAHKALKLPEALRGHPFPGEPLACAMNIFKRCDIRRGQSVAIIGIGFLGALLTRLAAGVGAKVIAISRRTVSLDLAEAMGASSLVPMRDHHAIIETVRAITGGALCDRVVEATGKQWPLDLAGEIVREGGRLIVAGYHQDGPRQVNMQQWNWKGIDVVNAHERDPAVYMRGMREAIEAVEAGVLRPEPLYTHRFRLNELGAALAATARHEDGFVKALVDFT